MYWYTLSIWPQTYKIQILLESVLCTNLYTEEHMWENYSKRQVLWYSLLPPCPALYKSQHSSYSDSNTSWTPGEPSEVPLATSTTTSTIKIGGVTTFFSAFGRTPQLSEIGIYKHTATNTEMWKRSSISLIAVNYFHLDLPWLWINKVLTRARSVNAFLTNAFCVLFESSNSMLDSLDFFYLNLKSALGYQVSPTSNAYLVSRHISS